VSDLPHRHVDDPRELRALAHPLRIRILEQLFLAGPLTATEMAERVGESPANCSWHLRQLAKHRYVEEAPGGTGRQRPWRPVLESRSWNGSGDSPEAAVAGDAMTTLSQDREFEEYQRYRERMRTEPPEWFDAAFWSQSFAWLTVEELSELQATLQELMLSRAERFTDPSTRPAGARPIRFVAWGVPATPFEQEES
jgi:DNA-binding transcriptional ArsR family regulator